MASGVSFIYASSEKNRMLACRFGEHRDNSRNSQSVFLVVYASSSQSVFLVVYLLLISYSSLCNRISALGAELISSYKWSSTFAAYRLSRLLWLYWLALELSLLLWLHWLSLELSLLWWHISIHILLWHSLISIHHFLSD